MPTPVDAVLEDIGRALDAGVWLGALITALMVPDICAALEQADGRTSGARYRAWYERYLSSAYPRLTADDCYSLRCGVAHQGRMGHQNSQYGRVIFTLPNKSKTKILGAIVNDYLSLDLITFCEDFAAAVKTWHDEMGEDPIVISNSTLIVQYRPNGLAPYIVGLPMLA